MPGFILILSRIPYPEREGSNLEASLSLSRANQSICYGVPASVVIHFVNLYLLS